MHSQIGLKKDTYYQNPRISQSYIKALLNNGFVPKDEDKSKYLMGTLVDIMLTEHDNIDNIFIISGSSPTGKKKIFMDYLLKEYDPVYNDISRLAKEAYDHAEYKTRTPEQYFEEVMVDPWFVEQLALADKPDAVLTDQATYDKAHLVASSLLTDPVTGYIINQATHTQLEIYFDIVFTSMHGFADKLKVIPCKAKLDVVIEGDDDVFIYDIKTTRRGTNNFMLDIIDYRYDIQAYFYRLACRAMFPNKTVHHMKFIVESHVYPGEPRVYGIHSSLNELKAMHDIKRGLLLADIHQREGTIMPSVVDIDHLWETEPLNTLLDKQIYAQHLGTYLGPDWLVESRIST